jgi:L-ascorbate metabolism protein UlaG (beta-lactamase superfamily)
MSLAKQIREYPVPKDSLALWWFGQNGYIFKTSEGTLTGVDLYLTDSCAPLYPQVNLRRQVPVLISPEDLDVDIFTCTHNHQDHTDPETVRGLRNKDTIQFIGPHPSCDVFAAEGVESGRIIPMWPQRELEVRDLQIRGTFAMPTDHSDLNHMGYIFRAGSRGPKVYVTGDTDFTELLFEAGRYSPDLVITCINGGFNNLSHWEAARLVGKIKPKAAIPCHYDMFPDNQVDPRMFRASMAIEAPGVVYQELEYGRPYLFHTDM